MNSRSFVNFLGSKAGKLYLFLGAAFLLCVVLALTISKTPPPPQAEVAHRQGSVTMIPSETVVVPRPRPPAPKPAPIQRIRYCPLVGYQTQTEPPATDVVPYGTLVPAVVVTPAESTDPGQPIIAVVTEDVYTCQGRLALPCKTLMHGHVGGDSGRRVLSREDWVVVFQDGRELNQKGTLLQNGDYHNGHYNIMDGQIGMYGSKEKEGGFLGMFAKGFVRTYPATPVYLYLLEPMNDQKAVAGASALTTEERALAQQAVKEEMLNRPNFLQKVFGRKPAASDMMMAPRVAPQAPAAQPVQQQAPPLINWQAIMPPPSGAYPPGVPAGGQDGQ